MKITKRQLRRIIKEAMVQSYDLGREDSLAGIRPQLSDEDYMRGYNDAHMDAGIPAVQPPSDSGSGKKLDPNLLKGATVSSPEEREEMAGYIANLKSKKIRENHPDYGPYDSDADAWYEERHQDDQDYRVHEVPEATYDRVLAIKRPDHQDHLFDLVDAYESGDRDISLDVLIQNIEDAELKQGMAEGVLNERRMESDVFKIVMRSLTRGPKTHQQLLANVLDVYPNTSDEDIDSHLDRLEDDGQIIFNPSIQKYQ